MNLCEIVGLDPGNSGSYRIAEFYLSEDRAVLLVGEMCDEYFGTALTPAQVDLLIAWLQARRAEMP